MRRTTEIGRHALPWFLHRSMSLAAAIVISSAALMCTPWQWHHRFGERIQSMLFRYLWLYALGSFAFGVLLLYGILR